MLTAKGQRTIIIALLIGIIGILLFGQDIRAVIVSNGTEVETGSKDTKSQDPVTINKTDFTPKRLVANE
jgi:hypothetical protein